MTDTDTSRKPTGPPTPPPEQSHGLSRRGWTLVLASLIVVTFLFVGMFVKVPYVSLGPGPTYDTLGKTDGHDVITFDKEKLPEKRVYDQDNNPGELRMTTVSVSDSMTLIPALIQWVSGRYALAPREQYFPPGKSDEDVKKENTEQFQDSQSDAEVSALRYLRANEKGWDKTVEETVLVEEVTKDGPSQGKIDAGDRLLNVNGKPVKTAQGVQDALKGTKPNDKVDVVVEHDGQKSNPREITLGKAPDQREQGYMGIQPKDSVDTDVQIDIKLADVGGPSAGLMFTLAIIDRLTEGPLTDEKKIAGTGEIDSAGHVGPIGGIGFKLISAKEDGASVFLVPQQNCAEARSQAPDGLQLVKVATIGDAVSSLRDLEKAPSCG